MTDTIRELIFRILDYVEKMPGAHFRVKRWVAGVRCADENQMYFDFWRDDEPHYVSRYGDKYWSQTPDLNEDNLRYLLSRLEGEER